MNAITASDITRALYEQQVRQRRNFGAAAAALGTVVATAGIARAVVVVHAAGQIAAGSSVAGGRLTSAIVVAALGIVGIGIGVWLCWTAH